jgi:hypothetical protein
VVTLLRSGRIRQNPVVLVQQRTKLDALTAEFDLVAAPLIPPKQTDDPIADLSEEHRGLEGRHKERIPGREKIAPDSADCSRCDYCLCFSFIPIMETGDFSVCSDSHRRYPYLLLRQIVRDSIH